MNEIHKQTKNYLETKLDTSIKDLRVKLTSHPEKDNLLDYTTSTVETKISGSALKDEFPHLHKILKTVCERVFSLLELPVLEEYTLEVYKDEIRTYFVYTLDEVIPVVHSLLNSSTRDALSLAEIENSAIVLSGANLNSESKTTTIEIENNTVVDLREAMNITIHRTICQLISNYINQHKQPTLTSELLEYHIEIDQNPHFYIQTISYENPFPQVEIVSVFKREQIL